MELPHYRTVERAEHAVNGFIRTNSPHHVPAAVGEIVSDYFGYFFLDPNKDPSNFITQQEIERATLLKQAGNELIKHKQYTQAIQKYTESLSNNPNNGKVRSNRCLCYLKTNDLERAFVDAKHSVHLEPTWHKSWLRLAQTLEAMERYSECLNIIEQASFICECQSDKKNEKILEKYWNSVSDKKDESEEEEAPINHMNDEDRLEWKHCALSFPQFDENRLSDDALLETVPYRISSYLELIMPQTLAMKMRDFNDDGSEFERWLSRKWISKCNMFIKLNTNKYLIDFGDYIEQNAPVQSEVWSVSWSAQRLLNLNKRLVAISVCSSTRDKVVQIGHVYGKPNARTIIQCIKRAMICPLDAFMYSMEQKMAGVDEEDVAYSRRPLAVHVQYRLKDEFNEIAEEMRSFGIHCELLTEQEMIQSCTDNDTNVGGWNYLDAKPCYSTDTLETIHD
eukprot:128390_1